VTSSSVQGSHRRLTRGAIAAACFSAGLWLLLRTLGLLGITAREAGRWWPALLLTAGAAILARSVRPGPHTAVAVGFLCAGGLAFATTRGLVAGRAWAFAAAGGLMAAGAASAWGSVSARPGPAASRTPVILVVFRAARFRPQSSGLDGVKIFLFCGRLDLDLADVSPGRDRDPLMIDITAWAGSVHVTVRPDIHVVNHKAFVMRFRNRLQAGILAEEQMAAADVVAATLAFFGDVLIEATGAAPAPASGARGASPGQAGLPPATR
jgi:hypothetical protein